MIRSSLQEASHFEYFGHFTTIFGHFVHFKQTCLRAWALIHFKLDGSQLVLLKNWNFSNGEFSSYRVALAWVRVRFRVQDAQVPTCPSPRCTEI